MRTNLVTDGWTDGRTDGLTDGQTQETTIPKGQYWPRVKTGRYLEFKHSKFEATQCELKITYSFIESQRKIQQ